MNRHVGYSKLGLSANRSTDKTSGVPDFSPFHQVNEHHTLRRTTMNLNSHQSQTVTYLENRCVNQHGLLVYHHMGTGKTNTAIAWLYNRQKQYGPSAGTSHKHRRSVSHTRTTTKPQTTGSSRRRARSHTRKQKRHARATGGRRVSQRASSSSSTSSGSDLSLIHI